MYTHMYACMYVFVCQHCLFVLAHYISTPEKKKKKKTRNKLKPTHRDQ